MIYFILDQRIGAIRPDGRMTMKPGHPATPTAAQLMWHDTEVNMFVHFVAEVYRHRGEPKMTHMPLERIKPDRFDPDQWVDVALSMDAKMIVMVAKHVEGFCLWQTETSDYGVRQLDWRNGKGDLFGDVAAACRRRGLRMGVYLSPQDRTQGASLSGRCASAAEQERYNAVYRQQMTELLSRYGEMSEIWFDGGLVIDVGDLIARYAPDAVVFQGPQATIRWVGNEDGYAPYPAWNGIRGALARTGGATAANSSPDGDVWLPNEVDTAMHTKANGYSHWCWWPEEENHRLKDLDRLVNTYYRSVGHGAVLLLNHSPDPSGLIPEGDARRAAEFGAEVRRRFGRSLAECSGRGGVVELALPAVTTVDHTISMEDIAFGERVRNYAVEGLVEGRWRELVRGTAIGHKKIDFFPPVTVGALRLRTIESAGEPLIRRLAAFHAGVIPVFRQDERIEVYNGLGCVGIWPRAELGTEWKTLEFDIAKQVQDARQYDLEIVERGGNGIEIHAITLVMDGVEAPEFISPAKTPLTYRLNITAAGSPYRLRVTARSRNAGGCGGEVIIHQR